MRHGIRRMPALALVCLPTLMAASHGTPATSPDPEIWRAAGEWLALVDARDYAGSWNAAARVFQTAGTAEAWARRATALREQGGDPTARELVDTHEVTDPAGVPPGAYVRLRFEFRCSRAGTLREILLMVHEGARGWRVATYAVEPLPGR
jgi:hypothetical protein